MNGLIATLATESHYVPKTRITVDFFQHNDDCFAFSDYYCSVLPVSIGMCSDEGTCSMANSGYYTTVVDEGW